MIRNNEMHVSSWELSFLTCAFHLLWLSTFLFILRCVLYTPILIENFRQVSGSFQTTPKAKQESSNSQTALCLPVLYNEKFFLSDWSSSFVLEICKTGTLSREKEWILTVKESNDRVWNMQVLVFMFLCVKRMINILSLDFMFSILGCGIWMSLTGQHMFKCVHIPFWSVQ